MDLLAFNKAQDFIVIKLEPGGFDGAIYFIAIN